MFRVLLGSLFTAISICSATAPVFSEPAPNRSYLTQNEASYYGAWHSEALLSQKETMFLPFLEPLREGDREAQATWMLLKVYVHGFNLAYATDGRYEKSPKFFPVLFKHKDGVVEATRAFLAIADASALPASDWIRNYEFAFMQGQKANMDSLSVSRLILAHFFENRTTLSKVAGPDEWKRLIQLFAKMEPIFDGAKSIQQATWHEESLANALTSADLQRGFQLVFRDLIESTLTKIKPAAFDPKTASLTIEFDREAFVLSLAGIYIPTPWIDTAKSALQTSFSSHPQFGKHYAEIEPQLNTFIEEVIVPKSHSLPRIASTKKQGYTQLADDLERYASFYEAPTRKAIHASIYQNLKPFLYASLHELREETTLYPELSLANKPEAIEVAAKFLWELAAAGMLTTANVQQFQSHIEKAYAAARLPGMNTPLANRLIARSIQIFVNENFEDTKYLDRTRGFSDIAKSAETAWRHLFKISLDLNFGNSKPPLVTENFISRPPKDLHYPKRSEVPAFLLTSNQFSDTIIRILKLNVHLATDDINRAAFISQIDTQLAQAPEGFTAQVPMIVRKRIEEILSSQTLKFSEMVSLLKLWKHVTLKDSASPTQKREALRNLIASQIAYSRQRLNRDQYRILQTEILPKTGEQEAVKDFKVLMLQPTLLWLGEKRSTLLPAFQLLGESIFQEFVPESLLAAFYREDSKSAEISETVLSLSHLEAMLLQPRDVSGDSQHATVENIFVARFASGYAPILIQRYIMADAFNPNPQKEGETSLEHADALKIRFQTVSRLFQRIIEANFALTGSKDVQKDGTLNFAESHINAGLAAELAPTTEKMMWDALESLYKFMIFNAPDKHFRDIESNLQKFPSTPGLDVFVKRKIKSWKDKYFYPELNRRFYQSLARTDSAEKFIFQIAAWIANGDRTELTPILRKNLKVMVPHFVSLNPDPDQVAFFADLYATGATTRTDPTRNPVYDEQSPEDILKITAATLQASIKTAPQQVMNAHAEKWDARYALQQEVEMPIRYKEIARALLYARYGSQLKVDGRTPGGGDFLADLNLIFDSNLHITTEVGSSVVNTVSFSPQTRARQTWDRFRSRVEHKVHNVHIQPTTKASIRFLVAACNKAKSAMSKKTTKSPSEEK